MTDYLARMQQLKQRYSTLEKEYFRLQTRLEELERQKQQLVAKFRDLGYEDIDAIPQILSEAETKLTEILADIASAIERLEKC